MNGKLKGIIACAAIVLCLTGALVFLNVTDKDTPQGSNDSSSAASDDKDESVMLIDSSEDKISKVKVKNQYGEFTVEKPKSGKTEWYIESLDGLNQDASKEASLVKDAAQIEAKRLVEDNASDLSKYGFDDPQGTFEIEFTDGTQRIFYIGDNMPESDNYSYITEKDSNKVYSVFNTRVDDFLSDKKDYLNKTLIEKPEEEEEVYGDLIVKRPDLERDMEFTDDPNPDNEVMSAQIMISPIYSYLNGTVSTNITHGLWGLAADSAEVIFPNSDDLKKYGIDEPITTVIYNGNGNDYTLRIGDPVYKKDTEGNATTVIEAYYCYLEGISGIDCIWKVSADSLPWTTVIPEDIITSVMTYNNIVTVDKIVVNNEGKTTTYSITSNDDEVTSAEIDGKAADVDQFKSFYQFILTCPTSEIYSVEPKGDSFLSIEIKVKDGGDKIEFFKDSTSERKAVVKLNGTTSFRIPIKWTEKFIKNMSLLADGKEVDESY